MSLMKKLNLNLSSFIIILFLINFSLSADIKSLSGKPKVVDGDTININDEKIRFSGIDAPDGLRPLQGQRPRAY